MTIEIRRNEEACTGCMLCVRDCVSLVFREVDGAPLAEAPEACNRCSHCLAVCPAGALEHEALDAAQVRPVNRELLSAEVHREIVRTRRSVRHYQKKPVAKKTVAQILDLARYSPTASNTQHVEYIVVRDREVLQKVSAAIFGMGARIHDLTLTRAGGAVAGALEKAGAPLSRYLARMEHYRTEADRGRDYILHGAPCLILVMAPSRASFACDDCNIAATNITNHAHAMGLGTCYIGFLTLALRFSKSLRRTLGVPKGRRVFASLVLGYPAVRHPNTTSRKPPAVTWL